ncbi:MAG: zinc/manganese transport system permease protein [Gammaproteobacteria bacterium]|jgi:zinc/manganese transport system permease protein
MLSGEFIEIMGPALLAGLMVALVHVPLGMEVLARGIVFIDLAIAQIAGLCVVLVNYWVHEPSWGTVQFAVATAALCAAVLFRWVERTVPREQEAIIGSSFILAASAMLLALVDNPHAGEEISHILAGQILFVRWSTVAAFSPIFVVAFVLWFAVPLVRRGLPFFILFALVVTASVQLVGVYVVFASLILPALAVNTLRSNGTVVAVFISICAVLAGIAVSTWADLPAGPALVFAFAISAVSVRFTHRVFLARGREFTSPKQ